GGKTSPASVQLEQQRLRRLAGEPELAASRVVAEALERHRRNGGRQELVLRNDGERADELGRIAPDQDGEAAEARRPRALEQREARSRVVGDERRRARAERRSDRTLVPRIDVEQREHDALALFGQRARGRRKTLSLGERAVERAQPVLVQAHLLGDRSA